MWNKKAKKVEKYNDINFNASKIYVQSNKKKKIVTVISISWLTKYYYHFNNFYTDKQGIN